MFSTELHYLHHKPHESQGLPIPSVCPRGPQRLICFSVSHNLRICAGLTSMPRTMGYKNGVSILYNDP